MSTSKVGKGERSCKSLQRQDFKVVPVTVSNAELSATFNSQESDLSSQVSKCGNSA